MEKTARFHFYQETSSAEPAIYPQIPCQAFFQPDGRAYAYGYIRLLSGFVYGGRLALKMFRTIPKALGNDVFRWLEKADSSDTWVCVWIRHPVVITAIHVS